MRYLKIIVGVLVIIVGVIFVLQNSDLQRPVKLAFDPLYMFRSHEQPEAPAAPAPVAEQEKVKEETISDKEQAPQGSQEESAAESRPAQPASEAAPADQPEVGSSGIPVFILVFLAFFAGILVASLFGIMEKYRLKRVVKNGVSRVRDLEEELKKLRNLPLTQPTTQPILAPPSSPAEPLENGTEPSPEDEEDEKDK